MIEAKLKASSIFSYGLESFQELPISEASIFPRFCRKHDSDLFARIDDAEWDDRRDQSFLLGYRSLYRELYAKLQVAEAYLPSVEQHRESGRRAFVNWFSPGTDLGIDELRRTKKVADKQLLEGRLVANSISVSLGQDFPIRVSGLFAAEFDYQGFPCFELSNYDEAAYHNSVSTHTSDDDVVGVFTWFIGSPKIDHFILSISVIRNDYKRSAFTQTCFEIFEHIYLFFTNVVDEFARSDDRKKSPSVSLMEWLVNGLRIRSFETPCMIASKRFRRGQ